MQFVRNRIGKGLLKVKVLILMTTLAFFSLGATTTSAETHDLKGEWTGTEVEVVVRWDNSFSHSEAYTDQKLIVDDQNGVTFAGTLEAVFTNPETNKQENVSLPFVAVMTGDDSFMMTTSGQFSAVGSLVGSDEIDLRFVTSGVYHSAGKYTLKRK